MDQKINGVSADSNEDAERVASSLSSQWPNVPIYVFQSTSAQNKFRVDVIDMAYSDEIKLCEFKKGLKNGKA